MKTSKSRFHSAISLILLASQLLLVGCGTSSGTGTDTTAAPDGTDSTSVSGDTQSYTDDQREYWDPLPAENLGGVFRVGVTGAGKFVIEEEVGEVINDAIFKRNQAVETLYSIDIQEIIADQKAVQSTILAGEDAYDIYMTALYRNASNLATADLLADVNSIESLNLDAVWWDQNLLDTTTIAGKQFFLAGDIDYTLYGRTITLFFNKSMMENVTDENIYDLVKTGKWTYDKFNSLQRNATRDLNGDNVMDDKDSYGIINSSAHAWVLYAAAGERIVDNDNGKFTLAMNDARGMDVITKMFEISLGAAEYCYNTDKVPQDGVWTRVLEMFRAEQALFQSTVLYNAINQRSMESDFGIIPYPKYDEEQENYHATSFNGNQVFMIPKTVKETERVGKIMNALAFEGRFTVKPAFYDEALGTKFVRDDESKEMLDIIFDSIIYDIGFMYNIGGLGTLLNTMHKKENSNFASEYAGKELAAKTALEDLVQKISEMN